MALSAGMFPVVAQQDDSSWPMFRNTLSHEGVSSSTAPTTNQTLWIYNIGHHVYSSPAVADGVVFIGSYDKNVYALNGSTGALIWNYTTGAAVLSSPAVVDGVVFVGSHDNNVYALNESTGAKIWSYKTGGIVTSSPAVVDGVVFVGSHDNNVYALNGSTGAKIWSYTTGGTVYSSPAVADGVVFVGSHDNKVYAFGNLPPVITPSIPDQTKIKNADAWTLDLTAYETDAKYSGTDLDWSVSGVNSSLSSVTITNLDEDTLTSPPWPTPQAQIPSSSP